MTEADLLPVGEPEVVLNDERAGKYVIVRLAHGDFGVPVRTVREVLEMHRLSVVPNAPAFVAGVMNLRGRVIPVIDLHRTFNLPGGPPTPRNSILVVRVLLAAKEQVLGVLVDDVLEVLNLQAGDFLKPEEYEQTFEFGTLDVVPYLLGVTRVNGRVKLLLDIEEVLNNLNLQQTGAVSATA